MYKAQRLVWSRASAQAFGVYPPMDMGNCCKIGMCSFNCSGRPLEGEQVEVSWSCLKIRVQS